MDGPLESDMLLPGLRDRWSEDWDGIVSKTYFDFVGLPVSLLCH